MAGISVGWGGPRTQRVLLQGWHRPSTGPRGSLVIPHTLPRQGFAHDSRDEAPAATCVLLAPQIFSSLSTRSDIRLKARGPGAALRQLLSLPHRCHFPCYASSPQFTAGSRVLTLRSLQIGIRQHYYADELMKASECFLSVQRGGLKQKRCLFLGCGRNAKWHLWAERRLPGPEMGLPPPPDCCKGENAFFLHFSLGKQHFSPLSLVILI